MRNHYWQIDGNILLGNFPVKKKVENNAKISKQDIEIKQNGVFFVNVDDFFHQLIEPPG